MQDFEKAFGDFIEYKIYDEVESALFFMIRTAFTAGWLASGGASPESQAPWMDSDDVSLESQKVLNFIKPLHTKQKKN